MKRKSFLLVCLVVACALLWLSGCQEPAKVDNGIAAADSDGPLPKITFETPGLDFGEVPPNKLNTGQIKFTNTGEGVLNISEVARCCSVLALLDKDKKEYAPGESGAVNVEWRSGSQAIPFTRELVVHSNDKANPAAKLKIQAEIVLQIAWEPKRLKLLLDEENAGCPKVTVRSLDNRPFSITGFKSTGDCITADFDPNVETTKFVFEPKVNIEKLEKNLKGNIAIDLTHPGGTAAILHFDVVPEYTVTPQLIHLLDPEPNKPIFQKIDLRNNYGKDFEIESVSSKGNIVAIKILEQKKILNGYQLNVEMTVLGDEVQSRFTDEFSISLKGGKKFAIGCRGWSSKKSEI